MSDKQLIASQLRDCEYMLNGARADLRRLTADNEALRAQLDMLNILLSEARADGTRYLKTR